MTIDKDLRALKREGRMPSDRLEIIARALCRYEFGTKAEDVPTKAGPLMWETFRGAAHDVLKHLEAHGYRIEKQVIIND